MGDQRLLGATLGGRQVAKVAVEDFMSLVLEDEGWQEGLAQDLITAVIQRLETMFPAGSELTESRVDQLRDALRSLSGPLSPADRGLSAAARVERLLASVGGSA
jgi:hypothetical protein